MPIPPRKKIEERIVSRFSGKRKTFWRRFHSSLALCLSAGDNGLPNRCAEAVSAINPATAKTTPTSWIKKILATNGFYQSELLLKVLTGAVSVNRILSYKKEPGIFFILFNQTHKLGVSMVYDDLQAWKTVGEDFPNMTIYYIYLLRKGPTWSPDETPEVEALQEAHIANMRRLGEMGRLVLNGPLLDSFATSGEIRGIGVLKANSFAEAQELISTDPMVRVGRLVFELHAWMVQKNILP